MPCEGMPKNSSSSTYLAFVIHHLHLAGVGKLDHTSDGEIELPTLGEVEPYMLALKEREQRRKENILPCSM